ncbi:unnamed protein product [Agarophyton chilense]
MCSRSRFSCSPWKNHRLLEKKRKEEDHKNETKVNKDEEKLICKQFCMPAKQWALNKVPEISLKDVCLEVPNQNFEMDQCGFKRICERGTVFNVGKAKAEGKRNSFVALKWVRSAHSRKACKRDHYSGTIREAKDCAKVVESFMKNVDTKGWRVKVLIPKKMARTCQRYGSGHTVIVEPFLDDFYSFYKNSNDLRHMDSHTCDKILQALLHFSINSSGQKRMMTNLEGFVDEKKKTIFLSGPVMRNRGDRSSHGKEEDISAFLRKHKCSSMCRKPKHAEVPKRKFRFVPV